jgi:hypothetical protein
LSSSNTVVRSLHDVGAAGWFGGGLMGAVGLNGASKDISDPAERSKIAASGWARWAPVSAVAIGAHLLGGAGLLLAQRGRVRNQPGVGANTIVKTVVTAAALGTTAYSGLPLVDRGHQHPGSAAGVGCPIQPRVVVQANRPP